MEQFRKCGCHSRSSKKWVWKIQLLEEFVSSFGGVFKCTGQCLCHEERPSSFSDSKSFSSFNLFAAALLSLSPVERYEAEFVASEVL